VAFGLIVSVLFSGPSGVINNVGIALSVIIIELGKDASFHYVLCVWRKITLSA
jgi:hypothetical protein